MSDPDLDKQRTMVTQQLIEGITSVSSRRVAGRIPGHNIGGFCRGMEVAIEFDEQKYAASLLERFLGLYTTINAFTQLVARTTQGEGPLKIWPPRAGDQQLI